jgi:hypothetical protein
VKFVLFVEGHTEKVLPVFLKRWLDPQLAQHGRQPVGIQAVRFEGQAEFIRDVAQKANLYLNAPKRDVIAVIGLLDLYGASLPYPADKTTATDRYAWAKQHLEDKVAHQQFRQHFAVHETEAWLLSSVNIFPAEIKAGLVSKTQHPEQVNFNEPPAKLLDRLYLSKTNRHYKKVVNGTELFAKLDPEIAYSKCPSVKSLLDDMQQLALSHPE